MLAASGGGVAVAPDDPAQFAAALAAMVADPEATAAMGAAGRRWVLGAASPGAVAAAYEALVRELAARPRRGTGFRAPTG